MQEKQIMVPKTVYETSDGQQFEKEYDAEKWECQLYFRKNMVTKYEEVIKTDYCVINSTKEAEILETLSISSYCVQKGFFTHYLDKEAKFPIMVKFKNDVDKPTKIVTENDYTWFKEMREKFDHLCKMYESINMR